MTFKGIIENIIGVYQPITQEIDGVVTVASGAAGVDWSYVLGGLLLVVFVYAVLRVIGGVISGIFR